MLSRFLKTLLLAILPAAAPLAQPTAAFSIDAYKNFLTSHQDMTGGDLLALHPAGKFTPGAPTEWDGVRYAGTIDSVFHLTDYEKSLILANGFMVSERLAQYGMKDAFINVYRHDLPVFVSTDAILHALHMSYDCILMQMESEFLIPEVDTLLTRLRNTLPAVAEEYSDRPAMTQNLRDIDVYLTVALALLRGPGQVEPCFADNASSVAAILGLVQLQKPASYALFSTRDRTIDFSQFTPRGHYADLESFSRYFQAMMWLGRTEIYLHAPASAALPPPQEDIQRQTMDAVLIHQLAERSNAFPVYGQIDQLLRFFVGDPDNVTLENIGELMTESGIHDASALLDSATFAAFGEALSVKSYAFQKIMSQILMSDPMTPDQIVPASAFLLLGQRFVIDSYITGNVVYDRILSHGAKVRRMLPSTLDILFALGNDAAGQLLMQQLDTYGYGKNLAGLRYLVESYDEAFWRRTMYNGWLDAIRALNPPPDRTSFPGFMQTAAWWQEKMNTQLASWSQLRHDNLLYAKQSYSGVVTCSYPCGYVEPIPEFYGALRIFADSTIAAFSRPPFLGEVPGDVVKYFTRFRSTMDTLASIASDELRHQQLDAEESAFLQRTITEVPAGCGTAFDGWYPRLMYSYGTFSGSERLVVADVHTAPSDENGNLVGWVLHGGTGPVNLGIVVAQIPDVGQTAFIGPVLSYYEVVTQGFKRLTDNEWSTAYSVPPSARPQFANLYLANSAGESPGAPVSLLTGVAVPLDGLAIPSTIALWQNFPNPFNAQTIIRYTIEGSGRQASGVSPVQLRVFDVLGREVAVLVNEELPVGNYELRFDGTNFSTGVYFYRLTAGSVVRTRSMILLR